MESKFNMWRTSARRGLRPLLGAGSIALAVTACDTDSLLDVTDPDIVTSEVALDTANLTPLTNGVRYEFARALTGPAGSNNYPGVIGLGGLLADELWYSSTFTQGREIDARRTEETNGGISLIYQYLQRSRNLAGQTTLIYDNSARANTPNHVFVAAIQGYSTLLLAETFCSGVPLSAATLTGELQYSAGQTTEELLNSAMAAFDKAIAVATATLARTDLSTADRNAATTQLNVARVGKARTLQNQGKFAEAAAVVAPVATGFTFRIDYSANSSGQTNGIWSQINSARRTSIASEEGTQNRGLRYFTQAASNQTIDPRVPVLNRTTGSGTAIALYRQGKYDEQGDDVPLASYVEAQLIIAESLLAKGESNAYLTILNDLRANLPTLLPTLINAPAAGFNPALTALPALTDPGTPRARVLQLYTERAYWLWLSAHRLGDLRRLIRHYGFQQNEVFPTGETRAGIQYGTDVNLIIPQAERNNPEFGEGCINREA